jgi:RNA polymerase-interacting CarD/CdnL/TRCF family regulator
MCIICVLRSRQNRRCLTGPVNAEKIHRVLSSAPCTLPLDADERSRLVASKLQTEDPSKLAAIVRDLTWRQRKGLATVRDLELLRRATVALSSWLAAYKGIEQSRARRRIWGLVERAIALCDSR